MYQYSQDYVGHYNGVNFILFLEFFFREVK